MERLTYKSSMGDYGINVVFKTMHDEICALRDALGKYEDLGFTPRELKAIIDRYNIKDSD